jgi:hypothetical protein
MAPRTLNAVCDSFLTAVDKPIQLAAAAELVRLAAPVGSAGRKAFTFGKLESIYELAYLQIFALWEKILEESFYRLLCGYTSGGNAIAFQPPYARAASLAAAEQIVLNGRAYLLWHNPNVVIARSQKFLVSAPHELVLSSAVNQITRLAEVRHHIAHATADTMQKFHAATMGLAGKRFGPRAGRFLRTYTTHPVSGVQTRWINVLADELLSLSNQIK